MTEQQWFTTDQVTWLLCHAELSVSHRKLAMFQLECCRELCDSFPADWTIHSTLEAAFSALDTPTISQLANVALISQ
ncbi:MAG: hypothetical protein MUF18_14220 [Fimbriiglobus sp.]|jgi:hypothetical protein|nr:hypothetical protein [Fimbriiglobus sp.]